jgi:hypothetical protein
MTESVGWHADDPEAVVLGVNLGTLLNDAPSTRVNQRSLAGRRSVTR